MPESLKRIPESISKPMKPTRYGQFIKIVKMHGDFYVMVAHYTDENWTMVLKTEDRNKAEVIIHAFAVIGYEIMPAEVE